MRLHREDNAIASRRSAFDLIDFKAKILNFACSYGGEQFIGTLSQLVSGDIGLCLKTACLIELNCAVC